MNARRDLVALILLVPAPLSAVADAPPAADAIRRIIVDPARLPEQIRQQQELIRMERSKFEEMVRMAGEEERAAKSPVRLLEARYHAHLENGQLVGRAEWKVFNPSAGQRVFPLDPWNLALRPKPTLNNQPAIAGMLVARTPGVLLQAKGVHTFRFEWSARGEAKPEGIQFDLQVPAAPIAALDIDLGADQIVSGAETTVRESENPEGARRWQILFGDQAHLGFWIRPADDRGKPEILLAGQKAHLDVQLDVIRARYEIDLESYYGKRTELQVEIGSEFTPAEVSFRQQSVRWNLASQGQQRLLKIYLPEPFRGRGGLEVILESHRAGAIPSTRLRFPLLRVLDAIAGEESLTIHTPPPLTLTDWEFGDFQPESWGKESTYGGDQVVLARKDIGGGLAPRFPSAIVRSAQRRVTVQQDLSWHVGPKQSSLTASLEWRVRQGKLFRLPLVLPLNWEVENITLSPPELLSDWRVDLQTRPPRLLIDLNKAADGSVPLRLTLAMRSAMASEKVRSPQRIPIPSLVPLEVHGVHTNLMVFLAQGLTGKMAGFAGREGLSPGSVRAPAAGKPADFVITSYAEGIGGALDITSVSPPAREPSSAKSAVPEGSDKSTAAKPVDISPPIIESSTLVHHLDPAGTILTQYRGTIIGRAETKLGLHMASPPQLLTFRLNGADVPNPQWQHSELTFLLPASATTFEVVFREESSSSWRRGGVRFELTSPKWNPSLRAVQPREFCYLPSKFVLLSSGFDCYRDEAPPGSSVSAEVWRRLKDRWGQWFGDERALGSAAYSAVQFPPPADPGWTVWQKTDPGVESIVLVGVPSELPTVVGLCVGVFIVAIGARISRPASRWAFVVLWLFLGSAGYLWLPSGLEELAAWPTLAGIAFLAGWWLLRLAAIRPGRSGRPWAATVIFVALSALLPKAQAQDSAAENASRPDTVYLLPGPKGMADRSAVLVPPKLWAQLVEQAQGHAARLPDYVLTEADYTATVNERQADVMVQYQVECFRDGKVTIELPLTNARLESAFLDSTPVLASPLGGGQGFRIEVTGPGKHALRLALKANLRITAGESELRCGIPPVTGSRLQLAVPEPARAVQAVNILGGQWIQTGPADTRLQADLGSTAELIVRWRTDTREDAHVRVEEAYLWELERQAANLYASLRYEVTRGAVSGVRIQLPRGLEVKSVEMKAGTSQESPPRLKDWHVTGSGNRRELVALFRYPVSRPFRVQLEMPAQLHILRDWLELLAMPRRLLSLPLPTAVADERQEGLLGYRLEGVEAVPIRLSPGILDGELEDWLAFWPGDFADAGVLTAVYRLVSATASPSIKLLVSPETPVVHADQRIELRAGFGEVEITAQAELRVAGGRLSYVEWQVPAAVRIFDLHGDEVQHWTRAGGRLQVWFKRPVDNVAKLTLVAWMTPARRDETAAEIPLPRFAFAGVKELSTRLNVQMADRVATEYVALRGLRRISESAGNAVFETTRADYRGRLKLIARTPTEASKQAPIPKATRARGTPLAHPPRVFLAEYDSQPLAGGGFLHRGSYKVLHESGQVMKVTLPSGCVLWSVAIDDRAAAYTQRERDLSISLPSAAGVRRLSLAWTTELEPSQKAFSFLPPKVGQETSFPAVWTMHLPGRVVEAAPAQPGRVTAAWREIHAAAGESALIAELADRYRARATAVFGEEITDVQRSFHQRLRNAERHIADSPAGHPASLIGRIRALREENERLFQDAVFANLREGILRARNDESRDKPSLPPAGSAIYYSFDHNPREITVPLATRSSLRVRNAINGTIVLGVFAVLGLLVPRLFSPQRRAAQHPSGTPLQAVDKGS